MIEISWELDHRLLGTFACCILMFVAATLLVMALILQLRYERSSGSACTCTHSN